MQSSRFDELKAGFMDLVASMESEILALEEDNRLLTARLEESRMMHGIDVSPKIEEGSHLVGFPRQKKYYVWTDRNPFIEKTCLGPCGRIASIRKTNKYCAICLPLVRKKNALTNSDNLVRSRFDEILKARQS